MQQHLFYSHKNYLFPPELTPRGGPGSFLGPGSEARANPLPAPSPHAGQRTQAANRNPTEGFRDPQHGRPSPAAHPTRVGRERSPFPACPCCAWHLSADPVLLRLEHDKFHQKPYTSLGSGQNFTFSLPPPPRLLPSSTFLRLLPGDDQPPARLKRNGAFFPPSPTRGIPRPHTRPGGGGGGRALITTG